MKPVVTHLRMKGLCLIIYIDDILIMSSSLEEAKAHAQPLTSLLEKLGFVINWNKSSHQPLQVLEFLGLIIDSMTLSVPPSKVIKILKVAIWPEMRKLGVVSGSKEIDIAYYLKYIVIQSPIA